MTTKVNELEIKMEIKPIGYIKTAFPTKFGLPRQSGICKSVMATLVFEPEYRVAEALRDLLLHGSRGKADGG